MAFFAFYMLAANGAYIKRRQFNGTSLSTVDSRFLLVYLS
jgi:hypothetical protein